jgi:hypothetical protein
VTHHFIACPYQPCINDPRLSVKEGTYGSAIHPHLEPAQSMVPYMVYDGLLLAQMSFSRIPGRRHATLVVDRNRRVNGPRGVRARKGQGSAANCMHDEVRGARLAISPGL